ncbi:MAG: hypothetical protein DI598_10080 [Pseudopedobacter saltans]|uniref:Uncharacterized protein n=1 Tax=Pseudopedobacter saltans TaxID=151895 RepID=A0A2W5EYQ6_9SPHI|nr:MAG: hypothetical protein DI598_10080 [Pseudopedobacter saltans]
MNEPTKHVFENFKLLKKDMEENKWIIEAFTFVYKKNDYIVLTKLYIKNEEKPEFSLMKVEFLRAENISISLTLPVNVNGFITTDIKSLRDFFKIEYAQNMKDLLTQFNQFFSNFIPTKINPNKPNSLIDAMVVSLSKNDSEDPYKIYCFTVKRNPNSQNRTPFNDNKSRLLRPKLYDKFKDETTISFCYSLNKVDERSDEYIIKKFGERR